MFINVPRHKLKRRLGLFTLCVIGIGGTIGGGIFVLLSPGAEVAGEYLPLSFILGGALAFMGALLYAELGTTIPRSGSSIELVFSTTRHKYYPFIFSWLVMLGDVSYLVINALGIAFYANFFVSVNPVILAFVAICSAALINLKGIASTGKVEIFTESTLVILLLILAVVAFVSPEFSFAPGAFIASIPAQAFPIIGGTALVFTTFVGYEYIASIAEEADDPAKNIPKALMISVVVATVIFTAVSFVAVNTVSPQALASSDAPLLFVSEQIGGLAQLIVIPAALIATAGSLLAATLVSSRRLYALSTQGYMRSVFSKVNGNDVPHRSVLGVATLAVFLLLSNSVTFIAYLGNTVYLIVLIVVAMSLLYFRKQRPYLARPFRAPFFPWMPLALITLAGTILLFVGPMSIAVTLLWSLLGYFIYLVTRINRHKLYYIMWGVVLWLLLIGAVGFFYLV